jgi:hypothetical protein
VLVGLVVGFWVVKRLFGREADQPADVATFDFYVEADSADPVEAADSVAPVKEQHVQ